MPPFLVRLATLTHGGNGARDDRGITAGDCIRLVTGSAGRIGRAVVRELKARGHFVRGLDLAPTAGADDSVVADLTDADAVQRAAQGVAALVHLAATPDDDDFDEANAEQHPGSVPRLGGGAVGGSAAAGAGEQRTGRVASAVHGAVAHSGRRAADAAGWYAATKVFRGGWPCVRPRSWEQRHRSPAGMVPAHAGTCRRTGRHGMGAGCVSKPRRRRSVLRPGRRSPDGRPLCRTLRMQSAAAHGSIRPSAGQRNDWLRVGRCGRRGSKTCGGMVRAER